MKMDSDDDSRPGSSASNSSSSSSSNSANENVNNRQSRSKTRSKSPPSRSSSSSSDDNDNDLGGPKSPTSANGQSRSPSPMMADDQKSVRTISPENERDNNWQRSHSKDSIRSMSSAGSESRPATPQDNNRSVSRNQSISPVRQNQSRASSVSSVSDDENGKSSNGENDSDSDGDRDEVKKSDNGNGNNAKNSDALTMNHEDLSDVSELDSVASDIENGGRNDNDDDDDADADGDDNKDGKNNRNNRSDEDRHDRDEDYANEKRATITDLRQKLDEKKNQLKSMGDKNEQNDRNTESKNTPSSPIGLSVDDKDNILDKKNDEDALDFEAEEGECNETVEEKCETKEADEKKETDGEVEDGEELEEGEVTDEDEKRPEETEPKPVCRFYTRGQCTWGMSCRFLHPGVTDKGNYTMFDMIRPVPVSHAPGPYGGGPPGYHDYRNDRPPLLGHAPPMHHHPAAVGGGGGVGAGYGGSLHPHGPIGAGGGSGNGGARPPIGEAPVAESAWERGLRTAKEMMRKANKRKEQDMDFEDKKMNLSASQDELEKDNYYIRDRASPDQLSPKYKPHYDEAAAYNAPPKYPQRPVAPPPMYEEDPYGRSRSYRELPPHRMPQYEDEIIAKRRVRPAREVIVQRAEPRGDEWNDPWMRSKSPGREKRPRRDRRSYSSNSSYSSSSSSRSGSSSNTSRSPTPQHSHRRRYNSGQSGHKSPPPQMQRRHVKRSSTPPPPPKRRHSPVRRSPPPQNARKRNISPEIAIEKRVSRTSPQMKRKRPSPPPVTRKTIRAPSNDKGTMKKKRRASSSASGSSDSSGSESESSYSSSSSSSSRTKRPSGKVSATASSARSRDKTALERKINSKKDSKVSPSISSSSTAVAASSSTNNSKKTTRREELLKQLKAVEDAIARKKSKLT